MTIDWDTALAPARKGTSPTRAIGVNPSAPAVKPAPFRTCGQCGKGFQRWPLDVEGRPCSAEDCPKCRSAESTAPAAMGARGRRTVGTNVEVPIPY